MPELDEKFIQDIDEMYFLEEITNERNTRRTTHNEIIDKALSIKRTLTYNEESESAAKHVINELCHRFGRHIVKIKYVANGSGTDRWCAISLFGHYRTLTWFEVRMWKWFGWPPKGTILDE